MFVVVVCRLKCAPKVTDRRILYLNKHRHGQSSSKKSRRQRVHLLFDDDGNAADATKNEASSSVARRAKSFLQAAITNAAEDQRTSSELQLSSEAAGNCLESVSGIVEPNKDSSNDITNAEVNVSSVKSFSQAVNTAATDQITSSELGFSGENCLMNVCSINEQTFYSPSSTVDVVDACSDHQDDTEDTAADADAAAQLGNCDDMNLYDNDDDNSNAEAMTTSKPYSSSLTVDRMDACSSREDDIDKYWWQRYRLFSRFDRGIKIDRGWLVGFLQLDL